MGPGTQLLFFQDNNNNNRGMASTFHINRHLFLLHMDLDPEGKKKNPKLGQINKTLKDGNMTLKLKIAEKR